MPSTLTCPRCDSPAPATERLCPACGHDLRTPVMEFLDPPPGEASVRRWIREVPPVVPLVASIVALVLAAGALAFTVLRPDLYACGRSLWDGPIAVAAQGAAAEDAWRIDLVEPQDLGWSAYLARGEGDQFATVAFVQVYCSVDAERLLERVRAGTSDGLAEEVRTFGDETFATRNTEQRSLQLWWRSGRVVGRITSFTGDLEMAELEDMAAFVYEVVR